LNSKVDYSALMTDLPGSISWLGTVHVFLDKPTSLFPPAPTSPG
jgi:hypothetical protein